MNRKTIIVLGIFSCFLAFAICRGCPTKPLSENARVDYLLVLKSKRQLMVYPKGHLIKTYRIALGGNPVGDKQHEGDGRTPEGVYFINGKNPHSGYHKNLGISYPDISDIERAKRLGMSPGGNIKIHGLRNGTGFIGKLHSRTDWTLGCIAVTDEEIDELYKAVTIGIRIEIRP